MKQSTRRETRKPQDICLDITKMDDTRLRSIEIVAKAVLELAQALNNPVQFQIMNNTFEQCGLAVEIKTPTATSTIKGER